MRYARGAIDRRYAAGGPVNPWRSMASGLGGTLAYGHLIRNLVTRDLRLKYKGTALGFLWSLANPILMLAVYTFAFNYVLDVPIPNFPLFFFIGYLVWSFLVGTLSASVACIVGNGALLNKVNFPRSVLPLSILLSNAVQFVLSTLCLAPVLYWVGMPLGWPLLLFPLLFVLLAMFVLGLAYFVAVSHTYYRDTQHLLEFALALWFWLTPIVYTLDLVPEGARVWFLLNPMTTYVGAFRDIAFRAAWPSMLTLTIMTLFSTASLVAGSYLFERYSGKFAELV